MRKLFFFSFVSYANIQTWNLSFHLIIKQTNLLAATRKKLDPFDFFLCTINWIGLELFEFDWLVCLDKQTIEFTSANKWEQKGYFSSLSCVCGPLISARAKQLGVIEHLLSSTNCLIGFLAKPEKWINENPLIFFLLVCLFVCLPSLSHRAQLYGSNLSIQLSLVLGANQDNRSKLTANLVLISLPNLESSPSSIKWRKFSGHKQQQQIMIIMYRLANSLSYIPSFQLTV